MFEQFDDILSVDDLCEALKIGKNVAYELLNAKKIKGFRIKRIWKVSRLSLEEFVTGRSV